MLKGWKSRFQVAQVSETAVRAFIWREMPEHVKIVEQERFRGERQSCARQKRLKNEEKIPLELQPAVNIYMGQPWRGME